eukprot:scpid69556/ scgid1986/ Protein Wnt-2
MDDGSSSRRRFVSRVPSLPTSTYISSVSGVPDESMSRMCGPSAAPAVHSVACRVSVRQPVAEFSNSTKTAAAEQESRNASETRRTLLESKSSSTFRTRSRRYNSNISTWNGSVMGQRLFLLAASVLVLCDLSWAVFVTRSTCDRTDQPIHDMVEALNSEQRKILAQHAINATTPLMYRGEYCAVHVCQELMQGTRWACHLNHSRYPFFGVDNPPKLLKGTKERAILSALDSAGVLVKLSRECNKGGPPLRACQCLGSTTSAGTTQEEFVRHTVECSRNEDASSGPMAIAKNFVDANEHEICKGSARAGRDETQCMTNLHNNLVGRRLVVRHMRRKCHCVGTSGSCLDQVCVKYMPDILHEAPLKREFLRSFNQAKQVYVSKGQSGKLRLSKATDHKKPGNTELVYFRPSPRLCSHQFRPIGPPVHHRYCKNITGPGIVPGSCKYLCCGGQFEKEIEKVPYTCNARLRRMPNAEGYRWIFDTCYKEVHKFKCSERKERQRASPSSIA